MQRIEWSNEFEIGIDVIDTQHRRIIDYINTLVDLGKGINSEEICLVFDSLVDYTFSHFAFEESLMEEAEYEFTAVHQETHAAFSQRIRILQEEFNSGNDVRIQLAQLLQTWLIEHIQSDDQSYAPVVRNKFTQIKQKSNGNWLTIAIRRCFDKDLKTGF